MIITDLIPEIKNEKPNYINNLQSEFNKFKETSEIFPLYCNSKIIENNLPKKTRYTI